MGKSKWPKERLADLRDFLQQQSAFPEDVCGDAAQALTCFLESAEPSLDHAFGQVAAAHRPSEHERRLATAIKIDSLRNDGKKWSEVTDELGMEERQMRKLLEEFEPDLMVHKLIRLIRERGKAKP
jgi:hypothetical protein